MILELKSTDRVCDVLNRVLDRMSEVVHRIDAPLVTGIVVCHVSDTVDDRITHVDIRRCHIDLCAENLLSVLIHAVLHVLK